MANRFPLVIDTTRENKIAELPIGDSLNLAGSDISDVRDIYLSGNLIIGGQQQELFSGDYNDLINTPVLFSGSYADLTNKPSIPSTILDLNILDGANGQVLTTDGSGTFTFQDAATLDYNDLINKPVIPSTIFDLGVPQGQAGTFLQADGLGGISFQEVQVVQGFLFDINSITGTAGQDFLLIPDPTQRIKIQSSGNLIIPVGTSAERGITETGSIRFNVDNTQFEGYNGVAWSSLGGVRDVDGDTFIAPELSPGTDEDTLYFSTQGLQRATLSTTLFDFKSSIDVQIDSGTISSDSSTGALTVAGGVGIGGNLNVNGLSNISNTTESSSYTSGALTVAGGVGIGGNLNVNGTINTTGGASFGSSMDMSGGLTVEGHTVLASGEGSTVTLSGNLIGHLVPETTDLYDLGSPTNQWRKLYVSNIDIDSFRFNDNRIDITDSNADFELATSGTGSVRIVSDKSLILPVGDTSQRPSVTESGMIRFNSQDGLFEGYDGVAWGSLGGVKDVDQDTYITPEDTPGGDNDELKFYTAGNLKITLSDSLMDVDVDTQINQIQLSGNTISTFANNDDINITPNGSGEVIASTMTVSDLTDNGIVLAGTNGSLETSANFTYDGTTFDLTGNIDIDGNIVPTNDSSYDLGTDTERWAEAFIDEITATTRINIDNYTLPLTDGTVNQVMKTDGAGNVSFAAPDAFGGNRVYVSAALGDDNNDGITAPVATIKRGVQIAGSLVYSPAIALDPTTESETAALRAAAQSIADATITYINTTYPALVYDQAKCNRDTKEIIDSAIYDLRYGGNSRSVAAGEYYYDANGNTYIAGQVSETIDAINYAKSLAVTYLTGSRATAIGASFDTVTSIITNLGNAPAKVIPDYKLSNITVMVASGDYIEETLILPDNVSVVGDNLRRSVIRPAVAEQDMFRVRNSSYVTGVTFRDNVDANGIPQWTFRFAISFDNVTDTSVSRAGYTDLPVKRPLIFTSPYVQNVSIISFIAGGGVEIDGNLIDTPNIPPNAEEAEFPAVGSVPEQGKSMVANAFTILSFDGLGWRVINDAYAQIVSCFVIFTQQGALTQTGGYLSITNSASNFGLFALRSSGYSNKSFEFNRSVCTATGTIDGAQTLTLAGLGQPALEDYILEIFDSAATVPFSLDDPLCLTENFTQNATNRREKQFSISNITASSNDIEFFTDATKTIGDAHPFVVGDRITYYSQDNVEINGIYNELGYYVGAAGPNNIALYHDAEYTIPVTNLNEQFTTGFHSFETGVENIIVTEVTSTHSSYQDVEVPAGSYNVVLGDTLSGQDSVGDPIIAYIAGWDPVNYILTLSIELVQDGLSTIRRAFSDNSLILAGEIGNGGNISLGPSNGLAIVGRSDLYTSTFKVRTTLSQPVSNISNMIPAVGVDGKKVNLHRPSICNSSAHTWEYSGSGIDYNALPQNGGVTNEFFEQVDDAPGRVYASGTTEIGDFKIGTAITAFNRTGNIEFENKVNIGVLDSLALSLSSGITVTEISSDIELGDSEIGGASDSRLVTQKAVKSFLNNRLGDFIDQSVSTSAIPNSVVQLDSAGLLSADMIPPTSAFQAYQVGEFEGRFELHLDIPTNDLASGDIVVEKYDQQTLTLNTTVTVTKGTIVTQLNSGATGEIKVDNTGTNIILVGVTGTFTTNVADTLDLTGNPYPISVGTSEEQTDNYFLSDPKVSQYLILDPAETYDFSNIIAANTELQGAVSGAVIDEVTAHDVGVMLAVNFTTFNGGSGYLTDGVYLDVAITQVSSSGTGALADITINGGSVINIDIKRGGSGYAIGDTVSISSASVGGIGGSDTAVFTVTDAENRLYVELNRSAGLLFNASDVSPDFLIDDNPSSVTINPQDGDAITVAFDSRDTGTGGDIVAASSTFNVVGHGLTDGDPIEYDNNANIVLGGLTPGDTYFANVIDGNNFKLHTDYALSVDTEVEISSTSTGTQNFIVRRVNTGADFFFIASHGLTTGDAVRYDSATPPAGITDEQRLFVGSVTTNAFTLHVSRGAALTSINGLTVSPIDTTSQGSSSATLEIQNVRVIGDINTSGKDFDSWSSLTQTTIDASNIVSGIIETSRLGVGSATNKTFLRGDSQFVNAVQGVTTSPAYVGANNPVTLTGDFTTDGNTDTHYNIVDVKIEVASTSNPSGNNPIENLGVAAFDYDYFVVDANGKVTVKDSASGGATDATTLDGKDSTFYQNPENLDSEVPVSKGGTHISSMTKGDILYAATDIGGTLNDSMSTLGIGSQYDVLMVDGNGLPIWSSDLNIGNIQIAVTDNNTIDTSSGNLKLDSAGGTVEILDNVDLGGANTDTISLVGKIDTDVVFSSNSSDIGDATNYVRDMYLGRDLYFKGATNTNEIILPTNLADALTIKDDAGTPVELMIFTTTTGSPSVTVKGNLIVDGTTTTVNSTTVTIDDPIFTLGGDTAPAADDNKDRGIEFNWHDGTNAKVGFFGYDDSASNFVFIPDATNTSEVFTGDPGVINVSGVTHTKANTDLTLSANGTGAVYVNDTLKLSGNITKGTGTITVPNNTNGTMAIGVSDTTGQTGIDLTLSAAGTISGTASGLGTAASPTFSGINIENTALPSVILKNTGDNITTDPINSIAGSLVFQGKRDDNVNINYANITVNISDDTDTTEDSYMNFTTVEAGGNVTALTLGNAGTSTLRTNLHLSAGHSLSFEGASANNFETTLAVTDPTADRTITLPDATGTVAVAVSDTTGQNGIDLTLSAAGTISGTASGLTTTSNVTFANLTANGNVALGNARTDTIAFNGTITGGTPFVLEGPTANDFETSIAITEPTADRTITIPDATGTFAVTASDTTTTTQGNLNLDLTLSAAGNISGTGDAHGLGTGDSPTFTNLTLSGSNSAEPKLRIANSNADANAPILELGKTTTGEADNDDLGIIRFYGKDSGNVEQVYAQMLVESTDVTAATEDSKITFKTLWNGVEKNILYMTGFNLETDSNGLEVNTVTNNTSGGYVVLNKQDSAPQAGDGIGSLSFNGSLSDQTFGAFSRIEGILDTVGAAANANTRTSLVFKTSNGTTNSLGDRFKVAYNTVESLEDLLVKNTAPKFALENTNGTANATGEIVFRSNNGANVVERGSIAFDDANDRVEIVNKDTSGVQDGRLIVKSGTDGLTFTPDNGTTEYAVRHAGQTVYKTPASAKGYEQEMLIDGTITSQTAGSFTVDFDFTSGQLYAFGVEYSIIVNRTGTGATGILQQDFVKGVFSGYQNALNGTQAYEGESQIMGPLLVTGVSVGSGTNKVTLTVNYDAWSTSKDVIVKLKILSSQDTVPTVSLNV